ncbi:Uncharacterised protein [uncultured archaeon]|nr:Uncharacterised protein [uncultured archaeon]
MSLPKKLRIEINDAVRIIEELDPYCEDPKSFDEKMKNTIAILDRHGVIAESDYRTRLREAGERARQDFIEKQKEDEEWNKPVENKPKNQVKIYSGLLRETRIKASINGESYSLKRFPRDKIDLAFRWRFNLNGRLENLDVTTKFGSEPIVSIKNLENRSSEIEYYPLPEKAMPFISSFKNNPKPVVYEMLIRFGYNNTNDLWKDLNSGKIPNSPFSDGETALAEIVDNHNAMQMIKSTAIIFPYLDITSSGKWVISYKPYREIR